MVVVGVEREVMMVTIGRLVLTCTQTHTHAHRATGAHPDRQAIHMWCVR